MIETELREADGIVVAKAIGEISKGDYETRLVPVLDEAIKAHGKVKILYWFGPEFEGFSGSAMWADMRLGMQHMKDIAKIAVVTDSNWLSGSIHAVSWMLPMPVEVFDNDKIGAANDWLVKDE
ncbi:STAS/SEC14 domain-containing protein [Pseudooceanicola sp. LIPI14-2-Ac024]|uniref:STAS/SEC14 domain-containing protein n=1 Tax=Pseudooceanicola sp. LIPI14-2-Ac024 TaxID=3344875 RepID=UPI0035D04752